MTPIDPEGLAALGVALRDVGYGFVTPTPETHRRVLARRSGSAIDLRDIFGWSLPFEPAVLPRTVLRALTRCGAYHELPDGLLRSMVRFSSLGTHLFAHSAYPTVGADAVFFGPDTYRYCAFLQRHVSEPGRVVDVGCGSGAGGLSIASRASEVVLGDINPIALTFARGNAHLAGCSATVVTSDVLQGVAGTIDTVISNPPYLVDPSRRAYRDGGAALGTALAVRIATEALGRLRPGGMLALYTGAPIVAGHDRFFEQVEPLAARCSSFSYQELDVDVFGEELETEAYREVERIAVVGLVARV